MSAPLRVLIVEDSEDDTVLLLSELRRGGYAPTFERVDAPAAMKAALASQAWDIVIADHAMPHFSAPAALALMQESGLGLPFIIVSGAIGEDVAVEAMRAGAHDYIRKGDLTRLIPAIQRELREAGARRARREAEEKYRRLFLESRDAIHIATWEGTFVDVNQAWLDLFSYTREEAEGLNVRDVYASPGLRGEVLREIERKGFIKDREVKYRKKDGTEMDCLLTATVWRGSDGSILGTQGILRDITERKRIEEERIQRTRELEAALQQLQATQRQLIHAEKLGAIGQLISTIAHEINNPLAGVLGYVQLLLQRDLSEDLRRDAEIIYQETQRVVHIVQDLLVFARKREPERKRVSINEAVKKTLALREYEMRVNNLEVVVELQPDLPQTVADFHQMQQVFLNLITNAEQAMAEAHGRGTLVVRTRQAGQRIQVVFADDGPGIPQGYLSRIFEPFFTTKAEGKGTGLGLSLCQEIVQDHGGTLRVESRGEGATFIVELPVV